MNEHRQAKNPAGAGATFGLPAGFPIDFLCGKLAGSVGNDNYVTAADCDSTTAVKQPQLYKLHKVINVGGKKI